MKGFASHSYPPPISIRLSLYILINGSGPCLLIDHEVHPKPSDLRTGSTFLSKTAIWISRYRSPFPKPRHREENRRIWPNFKAGLDLQPIYCALQKNKVRVVACIIYVLFCLTTTSSS